MRLPRVLSFGVLFCLLLVVAGCFPIELDVTADGKLLIARAEGFFLFDSAAGKTQKLLGPELGEPIFARWSPNGKEILAVTKSKEAYSDKFVFSIVPLSGGEPREIAQLKNAAYVRYSPDGQSLLVATIPDNEDPQLKARVPALQLISVKDKKSKVVLKQAGTIVRWMSDSKRAVVLSVEGKTEGDDLEGHIGVVDVLTGKLTKLAAVIVDSHSTLDLSADNQTIAFVAKVAGKPGAKFKADEFGYSQKLYVITLDGKLTSTDQEAHFAIFSPSGKQLLLGLEPEGFSLEGVRLAVANTATPTESTTVAAKAFNQIALGGSSGMFPGWVNDSTVFYFAHRNVYGSEAKSVNLMTVQADNTGRKCVQPLIDLEVTEDPLDQ